jgi:hypothetical protein
MSFANLCILQDFPRNPCLQFLLELFLNLLQLDYSVQHGLSSCVSSCVMVLLYLFNSIIVLYLYFDLIFFFKQLSIDQCTLSLLK